MSENNNYGNYTPKDGSYVVTEQGDLGLGLSTINESEESEKKEEKEQKLV